MMVVFITVFSVMVVTMLIMAVGVMFGREPIKGSCGGLGAVGVEKACGCVDMCKNEDPELVQNDKRSSDVGQTEVGIYRP